MRLSWDTDSEFSLWQLIERGLDPNALVVKIDGVESIHVVEGDSAAGWADMVELDENRKPTQAIVRRYGHVEFSVGGVVL